MTRIVKEELLQGDLIALDEEVIFAKSCSVTGNVRAKKIIVRERLETKGNIIAIEGIEATAHWGDVTGQQIISHGPVQIRGSLFVRHSIEAYGFIEFGDSIEAVFDIITRESIKAGKDIRTKYGSIKAGGSIEAGSSIITDGDIEAGGFIKSGTNEIVVQTCIRAGSIRSEDSIESRKSIEADRWISAKNDIKAGEFILAGSTISAGHIIEVSKYFKIFAGLKVVENDIEQQTITAREIRGKIGHGTIRIVPNEGKQEES